MPNLNKVYLMGNLTKDPEIKYTPKGTAVASFGIAINRNYTTESGEKREEVTFINCDAWARTAEVIGEHFKKGAPIFVEGYLKTDSWDDKETGKKRTQIKVVVLSFEFIGGKREQSNSEEPQERPQSRPSAPPAKRPAPDPDLDPAEDDIPF